jgi:glycosyltransferase involved in cell wall biosynthesis
LFDEVHIVVLRTGLAPRQPVLRPDTNVWIYIVATTYWWQLPKAGQAMLAERLMFATGFRPDLIVARDPLESGLIALRAAATYGRTAQLHVMDASYNESGVRPNLLQRMIARYTIPRFSSVRVASRQLGAQIQSKVTTKDFTVLPQLNPFESVLQNTTAVNLREIYPQYIFSMLFIGHLDTDSTVLEVIKAAAEMLQNSSVCLIIIGDGPLKADCMRRAKALGIDRQIIYLPGTVDVAGYLKAAHILFVTDTDQLSKNTIMQAAYAGIPMLLTQTKPRLDLFTHLESVYFCEPHQIKTLAVGLTMLMNDVELRNHLIEQARLAVQKLFHADPRLYERRYRESIEAALFAGEGTLAADEVNND